MAVAVTYLGPVDDGLESAAITVDGTYLPLDQRTPVADEIADACERVRGHRFEIERDVDEAEFEPEPVPGYDDQRAEDVVSLLERFDEQLERQMIDLIKTYEANHKARKTVLGFEPSAETPNPAEPEEGDEGSQS